MKTTLALLALAALSATSSTAPGRDPGIAGATPPVQSPNAVGLRTHFAWADFDADGILDAFVVAPGGATALLRGKGDGTFANVSHASGFGELAPARFGMWADFDGDQRLDLYVGLFDRAGQLYRNGPDGLFREVGAAAGLSHGDGDLYGEWIDFDGDGDADLHLETSSGHLIYRNTPGGRFEHVDLELPWSTELGGWVTTAPGSFVPVVNPGALGAGATPPGAAPAPPSTGSFDQRAVLPGTSGCAPSIDDQALPGNCLSASSTPSLGMLYPISEAWFVSDVGDVGLGTTSPRANLDVRGEILGEKIFLGPTPTAKGLILGSGSGANGVKFFALGTERSEIRPGPHGTTWNLNQTSLSIIRGDVGIGVLYPERPLDVEGVVRSRAGGFEFPDGSLQATATLEGPQGPTGPAGADGADGAQGPAGADGAQGPTGPAGADGSDGADGAEGPQGPTGPAGADGADGNDGAQGPQGPTGPAGADGNDGIQGPTGPTGPGGAAGPTGSAGADGDDGAQGPQGPQGPTGPAGANGNDGAQGPTGPAGAPGAGFFSKMVAGVAPIGGSGGANYVVKWIPFDEPFDEPPIIICTASDRDSYDDSFNVTTKHVQTIGFDVIVRRQDQSASWGAFIEVHWLAIQP
ncbi:MAG: FG-GAP-like repeat-containing protein [Planctomycetota bacterium]|nr:FG-GAP-like repeat-containing protein [Planctomycetota bacterium]